MESSVDGVKIAYLTRTYLFLELPPALFAKEPSRLVVAIYLVKL